MSKLIKSLMFLVIMFVFGLQTCNTCIAAKISNPADLNNIIAEYYFDGDLQDASGNGNTFIIGPNAEFQNDSLYVNGVYSYQVTTPNLVDLDYARFYLSMDIKVSGEREDLGYFPIIVGGSSYRWFSVCLNSSNALGFTLNNQDYNHMTDYIVNPDQWYSLFVDFNLYEGTIIIYLNDILLVNHQLPDGYQLRVIENQVDDDKKFTFTNYSNGKVFNGYADNLIIAGVQDLSAKLNNIIAKYYFDGDTLDASGNSNTFIIGPNAGFQNDSLYVNGVYSYQVTTPNLVDLDYARFYLSMDIKVSGEREDLGYFPIIVGGSSYRWFSVCLNSSNALGFTLNNQDYNHMTDYIVNPDQWYSLFVDFNLYEGTIIIYLNDILLVNHQLPDGYQLRVIEDQVDDDKKFTFTNYSNGKVFNGYADNLIIAGPQYYCANPPSMDANGDCKVDIIDFAEFTTQWLTCGFDDQRGCP